MPRAHTNMWAVYVSATAAARDARRARVALHPTRANFCGLQLWEIQQKHDRTWGKIGSTSPKLKPHPPTSKQVHLHTVLSIINVMVQARHVRPALLLKGTNTSRALPATPKELIKTYRSSHSPSTLRTAACCTRSVVSPHGQNLACPKRQKSGHRCSCQGPVASKATGHGYKGADLQRRGKTDSSERLLPGL